MHELLDRTRIVGHKGGKFHELPAHHTAEAYVEAAGIADNHKGPLFRSVRTKTEALTDRSLRRNNALDMIKRRATAAGLSPRVCCHTFRATGITAYLEAGGTIEKAQQIAAHESPKTTKLYDRTSDQITLDEIERIAILWDRGRSSHPLPVKETRRDRNRSATASSEYLNRVRAALAS
jgi:integrase